METIIHNLFLVVMGLVLGVFASEPIKKLFTGKYKEEARQKKRVQLLLYIRENKTKNAPTTEEMAKQVFKGKYDAEFVYKLLSEIAEYGLIKKVNKHEQSIQTTKWVYAKK